MQIVQNNVFVELHISDFEKAKEFYAKIGFSVAWEQWQEEQINYLVMQRDQNILCFWGGTESAWQHEYIRRFPKDTKQGYGVELLIMVSGIEELYERIKTFAKIVSTLQINPAGRRNFCIEDPFGYYLRFSEPYNILDMLKEKA